jgi:isoamylase
LLGLALLLACPPETARLYHDEPHAPSLSKFDIEGLEHMGASVIDDGVNFTLWSGNAERIELLLFDDPEAELPVQQFEMTLFGDVWSVYVEGIGYGQHYGFIAWGSNWPYDEEFYPGSQAGFLKDVDEQGSRFNPNKLLIDPYARALHRDHDWNKGSAGTGESRRADSTWDAGSKAIVARSDHEWSAAEETWQELRQSDDHPGHGWSDLILYEVHPKGLTMNGLEEVEYEGSYRGVGEMAPYFQALGVTGIELMPVHEKPSDGGYWGYNNLNFFALENTYSTEFVDNGRPDEIVDEFKAMVDQLHQHGVEVIVDVVYNHTGEGGLWRDILVYNDYQNDGSAVQEAVNLDTTEVAGIYSFRGIDNAGYYALDPSGLTYWNNSGVGNQTRPNNAPMRRLILDSLRYMVEELHVDGFRFDLAPILGEQDLDYNYWDDPVNTVLQDIVDDPVLVAHNTRIIAEPWSAGGYYNPVMGAFPASREDEDFGWGEWNAHFRDLWRDVLNADTPLNTHDGTLDWGGAMTGASDMYAHNGRSPYHATNFITVHDGFTAYDLFSYDEKQNDCGVLNPLCCDEPYNAWCDVDSGESHNRSKDWGDEAMKRQMVRNSFVALLVAHGTPLLLGGDEWLRTQYGNNNAYSTWADNEWNWFRWGEWRAYDERWRMHDFVTDMIQLRKDHGAALSPSAYGEGMPFSWLGTDGGAASWDGQTLQIHYYDDGGDWPAELTILFNMSHDQVDFTLPTGRSWARVVDTQAYWDDAWLASNPDLDSRVSANIELASPELVGESYGVPGKSIVILRDEGS